MIKAGITMMIGSIVLQTGALAQLHVKNPGNVGIGISTPATRLHVNGVTTAGPAGGGYHLIINDVPNARWALGTGDHALHIANDYPVTTTWGDKLVINKEGNVGIGTASPSSSLTVISNNETMSLFKHNGSGNVAITVANNTGQVNLGVGATTPHPYVWSNTGNFFIGDDGNPTIFVGMGNGNVGIGTQYTEGHKLMVAGSVKAASFIANSGATWADYVFDTSYNLPSLAKVKNYINQHHHLPDVPSAEEVKRDGVNISDNQVLLLKKIEELTLYAIDQNEKLQQLDQQMKELMVENKKQKEEIENLKKKKTRR